MNTQLAKELGLEFPIFAFTHCRDVVAAVSKAGGLGVAILSHRRLFAGLGLPAGEAEGTFAPASVAGLGASLLPRSLFLGVSEKLLTACRPQAAGP